MTLRRLRCPAYPMCTAEFEVPFPAGPGRNSWSGIVDHLIPNGTMMGQRCPASGVRVTWAGTIKPSDEERITQAGADWVRRVADALQARTDQDLDEDVERRLRDLLQLGRKPDQPHDNYFPGRPADVPEPGVGERPTGPAPWELGGGFLGRAAVDNARDQLRTLLELAKGQLAAGQDTLARMTAMVDSIVALAENVSNDIRTASGLVAAAIGTSNDVPEPARRLQAEIASALETTSGEGADGVTTAMRVKIENAYGFLASAIEAANEYQAIP